MQQAWKAFQQYRLISPGKRAAFLRGIAAEIEKLGEDLIQTAAGETLLPEARLRNERARTMFQLIAYADACEKGDWMNIRIESTAASKNKSATDLRKMMVPLGPVVVFGAANFPFAYSTAGGDTASALAAGCPVIVKAHPAHANTSELVAQAVMKAAAAHYMPAGVFSHIHGVSFDVGRALTEHSYTKAIGFTGSFTGGKQIFDWAATRKEPIPVFAEMSSINPIFLLPEKLKESSNELARLCAASITLGVGQFCTSPGLIIGIDDDHLRLFVETLSENIRNEMPGNMLNPGIFKNYVERRANALSQTGVELVAVAEGQPQLNQGVPTIATTTASEFINNPILHQEVFGPFSIVVRCKSIDEMVEVAGKIEGQLTASLMATNQDILHCTELVETVKNLCGRLVLNGVPTGVEVSPAMHHGGPFPATTNAHFTSVGADALKRFARPIVYQNWPDELLPAELQKKNPLRLWRWINNDWKK